MQLPAELQPCCHHLFVFLLRGLASALTAASLTAASLAASLTTSPDVNTEFIRDFWGL